MPRRRPAQTILLVEDDAPTREALLLFLLGEGYNAVAASNCQEALCRLRSEPPPDLILLDLLMPVMDGYEFRRQQQHDPALARIPVVVVSGDGEVAQESDRLGDVGYLQKPVDADLLLAAIERFSLPYRPEVLVVEDEPGVRQMLDVALRHFGFNVRLAATGQEAVDLYREHQATIAVVLLDVQMPGMDGPATLAALRRINPEVRSCFMSGHTGKYAEGELLRMGAAHVLPKPFVSLSLLTRLLWDMARGACQEEKRS